MSGFIKYEGNPIFGGPRLGTCFDAYVWKDNGRYRMDFSWRPKSACAVTFSDDGIHWEEPQITLGIRPESGWEDNINRNCVLRTPKGYEMWYTGQAHGKSYLGYALSEDGINFRRMFDEPVMFAEYPYENFSVMNPCVLYENGKYRMWYSAGETCEPNVIAYAESDDGINWKKKKSNPIFMCNPSKPYERDRIGGCQVLKTEDMGYLMFYIGYSDIDTAHVCVARSDNGISQWTRSDLNPIAAPDKGTWDENACYKPTALWNEEKKEWTVWYNGRKGGDEYIGCITYGERNLFK